MSMITKASLNVVRYFMMRLSATNKAATGLTITTFDIQYTRELTAAATSAAGIVGTGGATTHVDNKVFELDATNSPGLYMVCFPDAAFATGVDQVTLNVTYDSTVFTEAQNIQLTDIDIFDAVRMGMTALPNAVVDAAGGLVTSAGGATGIDDLATPTNITAGTIATVTTLTNLPAITTNWLTAAGINASALNGKGDWNVGKTGYALTTADWNVGKTGYSLSTTPASATDMAKVPKSDGTVSWNSTALGAINAEVDTALTTTTYAEPGQGSPAATASLKDKIGYLYKAWRNKSVQNATTYELYNDDTTTVDQKATVSDDGTSATKGEAGTGP